MLAVGEFPGRSSASSSDGIATTRYLPHSPREITQTRRKTSSRHTSTSAPAAACEAASRGVGGIAQPPPGVVAAPRDFSAYAAG